MKPFYFIAIAAVLIISSCNPIKVVSHSQGGYTFKSFKADDNTLVTYVKVSDSVYAIFQSKPPTDPSPSGPEWDCLACYISKIGECSRERCSPDDIREVCQDKIRDCANEKCKDDECHNKPHAWRLVSIQ
jgi:hypothetical protein